MCLPRHSEDTISSKSSSDLPDFLDSHRTYLLYSHYFAFEYHVQLHS